MADSYPPGGMNLAIALATGLVMFLAMRLEKMFKQ